LQAVLNDSVEPTSEPSALVASIRKKYVVQAVSPVTSRERAWNVCPVPAENGPITVEAAVAFVTASLVRP
jgi:hypothetical protein